MKNIKVASILGALAVSPAFSHAVSESTTSPSNEASTVYDNFNPHIDPPAEPFTDIDGVTKAAILDAYGRALTQGTGFRLSTTEKQTTMINHPESGWRLRDETDVTGHIVSTTYSHAGQFWPTGAYDPNDFMEFRRDLTNYEASEFHWNGEEYGHYELPVLPYNLRYNGIVAFTNKNNVIQRTNPSCHATGNLRTPWVGPAIDHGEGDDVKYRSNINYLRNERVHLTGLEEFNGTMAYELSSHRTYGSKAPGRRNFEQRSFYFTFDDKGDADPSNDEANMTGRTSLYAQYLHTIVPWQDGIQPDPWDDPNVTFTVYSPYRAQYDAEIVTIAEAQAWVDENWRPMVIGGEPSDPYILPDFSPRRIYALGDEDRKDTSPQQASTQNESKSTEPSAGSAPQELAPN